MKKPKFECMVCKGRMKHVWTSKDGKTVGLRCVNGHYERDKDGKVLKEKGLVHPVVLVPLEEA